MELFLTFYPLHGYFNLLSILSFSHREILYFRTNYNNDIFNNNFRNSHTHTRSNITGTPFPRVSTFFIFFLYDLL